MNRTLLAIAAAVIACSAAMPARCGEESEGEAEAPGECRARARPISKL